MNFKNYLASVLIEELTFEERKTHTVKQMLTFAQTPYYDLISVTLEKGATSSCPTRANSIESLLL